MTKRRLLATVQAEWAASACALLAIALFANRSPAELSKPPRARNVVLVHGAWADGSGWSEVIPRLQAAGFHVTAVQNPLTSLADSVAATGRVLALKATTIELAAGHLSLVSHAREIADVIMTAAGRAS